ncbi:MAG: polysaccharide deacetylase family protein [Desulfobacterales bacterium]|jgi:peptidoglycan/xylan/chitin deacetylase (PgdA/CDA1 family)
MNFPEMDLDLKKLLKGRYEAEWLPKDFSPEQIVPDFAYNILNTMGLLYKPIVDQAYIAENNQTPEWPEGKPFAVCLTHDVDDVSYFSLRQSLRPFSAPFKGFDITQDKLKRLFNLGFNALRACKNQFLNDPLHCYERWLKIEAKFGAKSTFFFWPGWKNVTKHHNTDPFYDLNDRVTFDGSKCTVTEMIREIHRRGWEIGLHASWYAYNDAEELKLQKNALEKALGSPIYSIRQHYLHYDIRITPRVHSAAGFKFDSTLGFNNNIGFRFGTCYPWNIFDLGSRKKLPILEIPLILQDVAMLNPLKGMRIDSKMAFQYVFVITEEIEKVGGVLTLLWHPNEIVNSESWNLYLKILNYLREKNAWITSLQEVGRWWLR